MSGKADSYALVQSLPARQVITFALATGLTLAVNSLPAWVENYSLTGPRAPNKPYKNFSQFYPFYLSEHSDLTNRRMHLVGTTLSMILMAMHPMVAMALSIGCAAGMLVCNAVQGMRLGVVEGAVMVAVFLGVARFNNCAKSAVMVMLIGYFFAWVGHFFFEKNKPATFIYPSYSLVGDFRMWFDAVTGRIPGIWSVAGAAAGKK